MIYTIFMFESSSDKIIGHSNIQYAIFFTCKYVDIVIHMGVRFLHSQEWQKKKNYKIVNTFSVP